MKTFNFVSGLLSFGLSVSVAASDGGGGDCGSSSSCDAGASVATAAALSSTYAGSSSSLTLTSRATSDANAYGMVFAKGGVSLKLSEPVSNGDTAIDFTALGQTVVKIIRGEEISNLTPGDQAIVIEALMHNWGLLQHADDARVSVLVQALQPVRAEVKLEGLVTNAHLKNQFRDLFVALALVEAHRKLTSDERNLPLRGVFASLSYNLLRLIFDYRDIMKKEYPSDAQILELLTQFRREVGLDSRASWQPMVELMRMNLQGALDYELKRQMVGPELKAVGLSAGAGFALYWLGMLTGGLEYANAHHLAPYALQGMLVAPMVSGGAAAGWMWWSKDRRLERARAKVDDFIRQCHANLVQ